MDGRRPRLDRQGFTLIESLAVVGIVVILAVLIVPVYKSVLASAAQAKCVANLRKIHAATLAFAEDHDGKLPPTLGPALAVDSRFDSGQYWWGQAYLGRYAIGPIDRKTSTAGRFTQEEAAVFNCPARLVDGPDTPQSNGNPSISYMMPSFYPKEAASVDPNRYMLRNIENPFRKVFVTEGRGMSLFAVNAVTRPPGRSPTGLRRYHNKSLNVLFLDGHVEAFSGPDEELAEMLP